MGGLSKDLRMTVTVLILGAGAIGAFYASRLAQVPNTQISVVCRSNYKAVHEKGFQVSSPKYGTKTFVPYRTFASPREAADSKLCWDYVVISTKALAEDDSGILNQMGTQVTDWESGHMRAIRN